MQLKMTVKTIFNSWYSKAATRYRDLHNIPSTDCAAVVVQSMVYGNFDEFSGSGFAYTRNPNTGIQELYGEYLVDAAGEDVLKGIRTPLKLEQLYAAQPAVYDKLINIECLLETHYRDMQVFSLLCFLLICVSLV
jgi:pyruvate,orthophosphate dikinase